MPRKIKIAGSSAEDKNLCLTNNMEDNNTSTGVAFEMITKMYPNKINFSIDETAKIVNVSYDFIRERIKDGSIKAVRYGDRMMIGISELIRIINEGVQYGKY